MKLSRYLSLCVSGAAVGIVCTMASPAQAVIIRWTASQFVNGNRSGDFTFDNGAKLKGSFEYDTSKTGNEAFSNWNLTIDESGASVDERFFNTPLNITTSSQFNSGNSTYFYVSRNGLNTTNAQYINIYSTTSLFTNSAANYLADFGRFGSTYGIMGSGAVSQLFNNSTTKQGFYATAVPFDTPAGATITSISSILALAVIKNKRKKMALKTQFEQPMVTK